MPQAQKQSVHPADGPAAIGPYSPAVVLEGWVYTSGQVGFDPATGKLVEGGIEAETAQVIRNLAALLQAAGCSLGDIVKTTVFLKDMSDFAVMNRIYAASIAPEGVVPPARSTVEVAGLPRDARVEIEAVARIRQV